MLIPLTFCQTGGLASRRVKLSMSIKGIGTKDALRKWLHHLIVNGFRFGRDKLKENGTIWISGTHHNIFTIANVLDELDFKILNVITWAKTNPPPNISCRYFTFSTEFIIWARKQRKTPHYYNYNLMKTINGNKQMTDVWRMPAIARWEKSCGKHPTQKPLQLLSRIILASTEKKAWILDPFAGSSTTGIAANLCNRRFLGIEQEPAFINLSICRRMEIDNPKSYLDIKKRLPEIKISEQISNSVEEPSCIYQRELPF